MYDLISRKDASKLLGVSYNQIPNLCRDYGLQRIQIGSKWLFSKATVVEYLKRNTINSSNNKSEVIQ